MENYNHYIPEYDPSRFWEKLRRFAKKMGAKVVYYALLLYYTLKSPGITIKDRNLILGALGYLILPIDLIPDFLPAVGFSDDLAALTLAVLKVVTNITPDVKARAESKLYDWFKNIDQSDLRF